MKGTLKGSSDVHFSGTLTVPTVELQGVGPGESRRHHTVQDGTAAAAAAAVVVAAGGRGEGVLEVLRAVVRVLSRSRSEREQ